MGKDFTAETKPGTLGFGRNKPKSTSTDLHKIQFLNDDGSVREEVTISDLEVQEFNRNFTIKDSDGTISNPHPGIIYIARSVMVSRSPNPGEDHWLFLLDSKAFSVRRRK